MSRRGADSYNWSVDELIRFTNEFSRSRPAVATGKCWEPRVDVIEDQRAFILRAELAGVKADDIQIIYLPERHSVVIRGFRDDTDMGDGDGRRFVTMEIPTGQFSREIRLPDVGIDSQSMRAQYRNGFLIVMIPKAQTVVVTGSITITGL